MFDQIPSYLPGLELLNQIDADVITFETRSSGPGEIEAIGKTITDKKIGIGMIDHHTLQVEMPSEVADLARAALEHIPAERLILTSDCGMGREGMPRRHAFYKMVSLVLGANIVREELGLPTAEVLAAAPEYSLIRTS
jgi:5-methyltetrahydropteroyltriglutamate--homocysteine methyltransferase